MFFVAFVTFCFLFSSPDVDVQSPDEKSVITYVSTLYDAFPKVPDGLDGISPNVSKRDCHTGGLHSVQIKLLTHC